MKIKELVKQLQQFNQDAELEIISSEYSHIKYNIGFGWRGNGMYNTEEPLEPLNADFVTMFLENNEQNDKN